MQYVCERENLSLSAHHGNISDVTNGVREGMFPSWQSCRHSSIQIEIANFSRDGRIYGEGRSNG